LNDHDHKWYPRPDLGCARYTCACGAHGTRTLKGTISIVAPTQKALTVNLKAIGPRSKDVTDLLTDQHALLKRTHSTRNTSVLLEEITILDSSWAPRQGYKVPGKRFFSQKTACVEAAWLEWRINQAYRGNTLEELKPPHWFVREELGFAIEHGPSLEWVCSTLAKKNARALTFLEFDAPVKVTYPLNFVRPRVGRKRSR
jgi:hypothetical protein